MDSSVFYAKLSSPHPASSAVGGVVEALGGVGEQGVALVLQVEEVAVGDGVHATGREAAAGVGGDIDATRGGGKDLPPVGEQVTERAV